MIYYTSCCIQQHFKMKIKLFMGQIKTVLTPCFSTMLALLSDAMMLSATF